MITKNIAYNWRINIEKERFIMTKIDIISGFLGAGKTTFIKKMIDEAFQGEQIVLIENEFGEVGIDGGFLKDAGIQITEMNSGCICCSLVGDFGKNLNEVITKYHPDRILIEPSGVGKLSDVMKSVIDIEKEQDVKLNALVTVVNALKASKQMKAFGEFFNNQIEYATTVILSRSQNATPRVKSSIHPATRVFQAIRIEVNQELQNVKDTLENVLDLLDVGASFMIRLFPTLTNVTPTRIQNISRMRVKMEV